MPVGWLGAVGVLTGVVLIAGLRGDARPTGRTARLAVTVGLLAVSAALGWAGTRYVLVPLVTTVGTPGGGSVPTLP